MIDSYHLMFVTEHLEAKLENKEITVLQLQMTQKRLAHLRVGVFALTNMCWECKFLTLPSRSAHYIYHSPFSF